MNLLPAALRARLAQVRTIGAITGAGVSAESGIPTYRGDGGLYDDPTVGADTVAALSGPTLQRDPDRTWRAVASLAREAAGAQPNAAHHALVAIEHAVEQFFLLTQNVDRLHHLAGSRNVVAVHGDIRLTRCLACKATGELALGVVAALEVAPRCNACGGTLRPDAVLFEETLDPELLRRIHTELLVEPPDLLLVVGTTALFSYITAPVEAARTRKRLTVEVNPEPTLLSNFVDFHLALPAGAALPAIAAELQAG